MSEVKENNNNYVWYKNEGGCGKCNKKKLNNVKEETTTIFPL